MAPSVSTGLLALFLAVPALVSAHCNSVPNPPQGTQCGLPARATTDQYFLKGTSSGQPAQSVGDCAWWCAENKPACTGYFFAPLDSGVSICQLITGPLSSTVRLEAGSPFSIWDAACYDCPGAQGPGTEEPPASMPVPVTSTPEPASSTPVPFPGGNTTAPIGTGTGIPHPPTSTPPFPGGNTTAPIGTGTGIPHPPTSTPPFPVGNTTTPIGTGTGIPTPPTTTPTLPVEEPSTVPTSTPTLPVEEPSTVPTPGTTSYTTSTVCATQTYTITSCAPTVTNCPYGSVTTETIPLYTTVCPVTSTYNPHDHGSYTTDAPVYPTGYTASTVYQTNVYTITACPPSVIDCPYGSLTTETKSLYTTICPIGDAYPTTVIDASLTSALSYLVSTPASSWTYIETAAPVYPSGGPVNGTTTASNVLYSTAPTAVATEAPLVTGAADAKSVSLMGMGVFAGLAAVFAL